ncbi:MAG: hypothetical protein IT471_01290 [Pseudomonadales bacterium]|jgi:hypothetical protein|nr:hypothetical protein [Pseudomonadales bacterium]
MKTWLNRALLVTTYGITPYTDEQVTAARLAGDLCGIILRDLVIVSQFRVAPVPVPGAVCMPRRPFADAWAAADSSC